MVEFIILPADEDEEFQPPSYNTPGWVLFEVVQVHQPPSPKYMGNYEIEILDYDSDSAVFWIHEGMGLEYWINEWLDVSEPGIYVVEDITGSYHRGDWSMGEDDDENFEAGLVRYATDTEIVKGTPLQ